jgi:hypothetical protein
MTKPFNQLMYMIAHRQISATSEHLQATYARLEKAVISAPKKHPRTIILDWLETELASLPHAEHSEEGHASLLLRDAIEFGKAVARR